MPENQGFTVRLPEAAEDLVVADFQPLVIQDTTNDSVTLQWQDASVIERESPNVPNITFFHAQHLSEQPLIGLRMRGIHGSINSQSENKAAPSCMRGACYFFSVIN